MTKPAIERQTQTELRPAARPTAFRPVALPAVAAALHVTGRRTESVKRTELPAILRKDAATD